MKKKVILPLLAVLTLGACAGTDGDSSMGSSLGQSSSTSQSVSSSFESSLEDSSLEESASSEESNSSEIVEQSSSLEQSSSFEDVSSSTVINKYTIQVEHGEGSGIYDEGSEVTITADEPDEGYEFVKWIDSETTLDFATENPYTFFATKDLSLEAVYAKKQFTLTVTGGTINGGDYASGIFEWDDEVSVTAEERSGHRFVAWQDESGKEVSQDKTYTFRIKEDVTLFAVFDEVVAMPSSVAELEGVLAKSIQLEHEISSVVAQKTGAYDTSNNMNYTTTFYDGGVYATGTKKATYSNYEFVEYKGLYNNDTQYIEVLDFQTYSTSYDKLTRLDIVDEVTDDEKEITLADAKEKYEVYGLAKIVVEYLSSQLKEENLDGDLVAIATEDDGFKVTLCGHEIVKTIYHVYQLDLEFAYDGFIQKITFEDKNYVKSSMYDDDAGALKPDATPRNVEVTTYTAVKGEREAVPDDLNLSQYFIASYDVQISITYGSTMYVTAESNRIPLGASWYKSSMTMINVLPETAMESKDLEYVSSSDTSVIDVDPTSPNYKLAALGVGNTTLTFKSAGGLVKTLEVSVELFAPKTITISAPNKIDKDQKVELSATVSPTNADTRLTWSVDNEELAKIVVEGDKVYLQGQNNGGGMVVVTATSETQDLEGNNVFATKSIYVSPGELSVEDLRVALLGKWVSSTTSSSRFEITFNDDGTYSLIDNYRLASKVTNTGNFELTTTKDEDFVIFDDVTCNNERGDVFHPEGYVVSTSNRTYDKEANNLSGEIADLHFIIEKDGSGLVMHFKCPGKDSSSMSFQMYKEV